MVINLKEISFGTIERFFDSTLPLLTGLKYSVKIQKFDNKGSSYPYKISLEVTESAGQSKNYDTLKSDFDNFLDKESFPNRNRASK